MTWRLWGTEPKDGTWFLIFDERNTPPISVMRWTVGRHYGECLEDIRGEDFYWDDKPTHWMPLPEWPKS